MHDIDDFVSVEGRKEKKYMCDELSPQPPSSLVPESPQPSYKLSDHSIMDYLSALVLIESELLNTQLMLQKLLAQSFFLEPQSGSQLIL